jgi:hypothetical protein
MQRKFKDSGISFDNQIDSLKSKSMANFGGTIGKKQNLTAKINSFERSYGNSMKKTLFESLAGSSTADNTHKRTRVMTEFE